MHLLLFFGDDRLGEDGLVALDLDGVLVLDRRPRLLGLLLKGLPPLAPGAVRPRERRPGAGAGGRGHGADAGSGHGDGLGGRARVAGRLGRAREGGGL